MSDEQQRGARRKGACWQCRRVRSSTRAIRKSSIGKPSPGVFEGVRVTLGPKMVDADGVAFFPVLSGLAVGDQIVTSGSFLVDAETRLNPAAGSIYFGGSSGAKSGDGEHDRSLDDAGRPGREDRGGAGQAVAGRSRAGRAAADLPGPEDSRLGSMGAPVKLTLAGETVFLCCAGCKQAQATAADAGARCAAAGRRSCGRPIQQREAAR